VPEDMRSPLPFGIHRVPDYERLDKAALATKEVSIAFRHSPRSRPPSAPTAPKVKQIESPLPFGIHRVPDSLDGFDYVP